MFECTYDLQLNLTCAYAKKPQGGCKTDCLALPSKGATSTGYSRQPGEQHWSTEQAQFIHIFIYIYHIHDNVCTSPNRNLHEARNFLCFAQTTVVPFSLIKERSNISFTHVAPTQSLPTVNENHVLPSPSTLSHLYHKENDWVVRDDLSRQQKIRTSPCVSQLHKIQEVEFAQQAHIGPTPAKSIPAALGCQSS